MQAGLEALVATLKTPETAAFKVEGATSVVGVITALQKHHSETAAEHERVAARLAELEAEKANEAVEKSPPRSLPARAPSPAA